MAELDARGIDVVTTDVVGHQIMFLSGGRITASSFGVPRFDDVEVAAAEQGRCTYVLRRGHLDDLVPRQLSDHLQRDGIAYDQRGDRHVHALRPHPAGRPGGRPVDEVREPGAPRSGELTCQLEWLLCPARLLTRLTGGPPMAVWWR